MRIRVAFATALTMVPAAAFAHPGHLSGLGFADGFLHPLSGADHLAAALLVGALAAVSRRAHATPVAFLAAVAAGLLIGGAPHAAWIAELGIVLGFAALAGAILVRRAAAWMLPAAAAVAGGRTAWRMDRKPRAPRPTRPVFWRLPRRSPVQAILALAGPQAGAARAAQRKAEPRPCGCPQCLIAQGCAERCRSCLWPCAWACP